MYLLQDYGYPITRDLTSGCAHFAHRPGSRFSPDRIKPLVMNVTVPVSKALSHAERLCARRGLSLTPMRRRVLELLLQAGGPVKAYDLLAALKPGGGAQPPTVYRALDFLTSSGLAHKVEALNAYMACVHGEESGGAELFICEGCGAVEERHVEAGPEEAPEGFAVERSVIEHYGRCADCSR